MSNSAASMRFLSTGSIRHAAPALVLALAACASAPPPMYAWDDFPEQQYAQLAHEGSSSVEDQTRALEAQAEKARAGKAALPPGFRAHLGYLYLKAGNPGRAHELFQAEKVAFPESSAYMDRLLAKLDTPPPPSAVPNK